MTFEHDTRGFVLLTLLSNKHNSIRLMVFMNETSRI